MTGNSEGLCKGSRRTTRLAIAAMCAAALSVTQAQVLEKLRMTIPVQACFASPIIEFAVTRGKSEWFANTAKGEDPPSLFPA
jgi:hypothetical protein